MNETMEVSLGFGKATLPGTVASIACFRVAAPFIRDSGVSSGRRAGPSREFFVGATASHGSLYSSEVTHPEGTTLLFQVSWMRNGLPIRDGAVFLRLRSQGPLWKLQARLPLEPQNIWGGSFEVFKGRADILAASDLEEAGITPFQSYLSKFMLPEEVDECFIIQRQGDEIAPRPRVVQVEGEHGAKLVEVATPARRRMRIPGR